MYKLLKFSTVYPEFTSRFLADNPDHWSISFRELNERFVATHYGWADYFARDLNALGCEARDIFVDIEPLQKAWAYENGVDYRCQSWCQDIIEAQVRSFRPNVLFLQDLYFFNSSFRKRLREVSGKPILMIGWQAAPISKFTLFRDLDILLTCAPHFVEYLKRAGATTELLLHAFEPSVLASLPPISSQDLDFTFIGSFVLKNGCHRKRFAVVKDLMRSTPLHVWGEISCNNESRRARLVSRGLRVTRSLRAPAFAEKFVQKLATNGRELDKELGEHRNRFHEPVFGTRYYELLVRSKLTFNNHIDAAEQYAGNMRLFEATGAGTCLVTDWKENLSDLFEPGSEVVTYRSAEECQEKVAYLLEHEGERRAIAQAGHQRTLKCHTFSHRAAQLHELILRKLSTVV